MFDRKIKLLLFFVASCCLFGLSCWTTVVLVDQEHIWVFLEVVPAIWLVGIFGERQSSLKLLLLFSEKVVVFSWNWFSSGFTCFYKTAGECCCRFAETQKYSDWRLAEWEVDSEMDHEGRVRLIVRRSEKGTATEQNGTSVAWFKLKRLLLCITIFQNWRQECLDSVGTFDG